jgi:hypothetical protein
MGIFNKIRKAFRKGEALPHEHGPVVKFALAKEEPVVAAKPKTVTVKVTTVKNPGTKANCVCGGGTCKCDERKEAHAKYMADVAKKQKQATTAKAKPTKDAENKKVPVAKKPVPKATAKKDAIAKDIADTPVAKKAPAKKTPAKPAAKKSAPKKK